ncbi:MAG: flagellar motor protein [Deltaproteobacteria bacterium]|nr:flagellar motor protein [Deltaproteobacteria bacterium]
MIGLGFLIMSFFMLIGAFLLEGGHFGALFVHTAAMIVFGGTLGAVGLAHTMADLKRFPAVLRKVFSEPHHNAASLIFFFIDTSALVRREGVLALERHAREAEDELTRIGLQLVTDGVQREMIRDIMDTYVEHTNERHKTMAGMFESAGGFAPTMGIIGTVMGLVHVLGNLSDPGSLGPAIAVAFIATLYGVASANVFWLPAGAKLKALDREESMRFSMIIEAVLLIEQGANPRVVEEKLKSFLSPTERMQMASPGSK